MVWLSHCLNVNNCLTLPNKTKCKKTQQAIKSCVTLSVCVSRICVCVCVGQCLKYPVLFLFLLLCVTLLWMQRMSSLQTPWWLVFIWKGTLGVSMTWANRISLNERWARTPQSLFSETSEGVKLEKSPFSLKSYSHYKGIYCCAGLYLNRCKTTGKERSMCMCVCVLWHKYEMTNPPKWDGSSDQPIRSDSLSFVSSSVSHIVCTLQEGNSWSCLYRWQLKSNSLISHGFIVKKSDGHWVLTGSQVYDPDWSNTYVKLIKNKIKLRTRIISESLHISFKNRKLHWAI